MELVFLGGNVDAARAIHILDAGTEVVGEVKFDHAVVVVRGHVGISEEDLA